MFSLHWGNGTWFMKHVKDPLVAMERCNVTGPKRGHADMANIILGLFGTNLKELRHRCALSCGLCTPNSVDVKSKDMCDTFVHWHLDCLPKLLRVSPIYAINSVVIVLALLIYLTNYMITGASKSWNIFPVALGVCDIVTDIVLSISIRRYLPLYFLPYVLIVGVSFCVNFVLLYYVFGKSLSQDRELEKWYVNNAHAFSLIWCLASLDLNIILAIQSDVFGIAVTRAPLSNLVSYRMSIAYAASLLVENIPQLTIQLLVLSHLKAPNIQKALNLNICFAVANSTIDILSSCVTLFISGTLLKNYKPGTIWTIPLLEESRTEHDHLSLILTPEESRHCKLSTASRTLSDSTLDRSHIHDVLLTEIPKDMWTSVYSNTGTRVTF